MPTNKLLHAYVMIDMMIVLVSIIVLFCDSIIPMWHILKFIIFICDRNINIKFIVRSYYFLFFEVPTMNHSKVYSIFNIQRKSMENAECNTGKSNNEAKLDEHEQFEKI